MAASSMVFTRLASGRVAEVNAYIQWYNQQRIKLSLGRMSPVEYRQSLGMTT